MNLRCTVRPLSEMEAAGERSELPGERTPRIVDGHPVVELVSDPEAPELFPEATNA